MEINWKHISLEDRELIESFYEKEQSMSCEFTFANNLLWSPYYSIRYAVIRDCLVFISHESVFSVSFPLGRGDLRGVVDDLLCYFEEKGRKFKMHLVTEEQFERLKRLYPDQFRIDYDRDSADYIYEAEKLRTLAGKKLHAKRNHINKFKVEHPDWSFEMITDENTPECIAMANRWAKENEVETDVEKSAEFSITVRALEGRKHLHLQGGLVRADGNVVAFSLGEPCNQETYVVHIEKAFAGIQGAYPMINQQFVEHVAAGYRYVNREEDTGSEGLRKAKLSYVPDILLEKGLVTLKAQD